MKKFFKKQWPLVGLGVLLILVAFYLVNSGQEGLHNPVFSSIEVGDGLKLKDIHYTQNDPDRRVKWVLDAEEVRFSSDKKAVSFRDFRLNVEPENRPSFRLKGKNGDYSRETGEINLWGDLEGISANGYRFTGDHVLIDEKSGHLRTDRAVTISGPFFSVAGKGLFVDLEKETLKIISNVTTIIDKEPLI